MTSINEYDQVNFGLTEEDLRILSSKIRELPGEWALQTAATDEGDAFACIIAPWSNEWWSSFLVERNGDCIIVTDRISSGLTDAISRHPSVSDAMAGLRRIVLGRTCDLTPLPALQVDGANNLHR